MSNNRTQSAKDMLALLQAMHQTNMARDGGRK